MLFTAFIEEHSFVSEARNIFCHHLLAISHKTSTPKSFLNVAADTMRDDLFRLARKE